MTHPSDRLQHHLDRLAAGEPVDGVLADAGRAPDGDDLAALVALAARLAETMPATAPAPFRARLQARLQSEIAARAGRRRATLHRVRVWTARMAVCAAALVLALGTAVQASADSVPGDSLYGIKRAAEEARLAVAVTPVRRARVQLEMADARLEEIQRLVDRGLAIDAALVDALIALYAGLTEVARSSGDPELIAAVGTRASRHRDVLAALATTGNPPPGAPAVAEALARLERVPTEIAPSPKPGIDAARPTSGAARRPGGDERPRATASPAASGGAGATEETAATATAAAPTDTPPAPATASPTPFHASTATPLPVHTPRRLRPGRSTPLPVATTAPEPAHTAAPTHVARDERATAIAARQTREAEIATRRAEEAQRLATRRAAEVQRQATRRAEEQATQRAEQQATRRAAQRATQQALTPPPLHTAPAQDPTVEPTVGIGPSLPLVSPPPARTPAPTATP